MANIDAQACDISGRQRDCGEEGHEHLRRSDEGEARFAGLLLEAADLCRRPRPGEGRMLSALGRGKLLLGDYRK
jgi:hypothetical protein